MGKKQSDCEVIGGKFEDVVKSFGECANRAVEDSHSKMSVAKGVFGIGKSLTNLTLSLGGCAIKHTPKAIATVAAAKREIVTAIEEEVHSHQKQVKENALNEKIKALKMKRSH